MKTHRRLFMMIFLFCMGFIRQAYSQPSSSDDSPHPFHLNYWVTGTILGVGSVANYLGTPGVQRKAELSLWEIQELNKSDVHGIDAWALKQDPTHRGTFFNYSNYALWSTLALPASLLFDRRIRRDLFDMVLMYLETITIATNIYEWSFLGPNFQERMRPITYYDQVPYDERKQGDNRSSFFSGHTTSAAATTFFLVKVFSDYHPEIGNDKFILYGAALIPPLLVGYFRIKALMHFPSDVLVGLGVGALCGVLIPEFHRWKDKKISFDVWASPRSSGIGMTW